MNRIRYHAGYARLHEFFQTFSYSAFRLEVRRSYAMDEVERVNFETFLRGGRPSMHWMLPWLELIGPRLKEGRRMERVRVTDVPPSDYVKFEMHMTPNNVAHGEDIRFLDRSVADVIGLPHYDYWLFDAATVARMDFDEDDRLVGIEVNEEPADVLRHVQWRESALYHASPAGEYGGDVD